MTGAWLLVLLGPSAAPAVTARVPWSAVSTAHPVSGKVGVATRFAVPFTLAWHRAQDLSPLSDEASALKRLGLVYLMPALLLAAQVVCFEIGTLAPDWM